MMNGYRDNTDDFKLVPLNIPDNFKGGFMPMGAHHMGGNQMGISPMGSPNMGSNMGAPHMNKGYMGHPNINSYNINMDGHYMNPQHMWHNHMDTYHNMMHNQNYMKFNNGCMGPSCPMYQQFMQMSSAEAYQVIKTPIIARQASELFD